MPGWSSLSASRCWIKHACHTLRLFTTRKSQPPCLRRASRIPLFTLLLLYLSRCISVHLLSPLSPSAPPPSPFSLPLFPLFLFPLRFPSLFHLIGFVLPGDHCWTERFPLSYKSREWLTAPSALPKLSRQHLPLPPVCTVEAEEEVWSVQDHTIVFAASRHIST